MLSTVLLIVLILLLIGAIPAWPYNRTWGDQPWGYGPAGLIVIVLILFLILG